MSLRTKLLAGVLLVLAPVLVLLIAGLQATYTQRREAVLDSLVGTAQALAVATDLVFDEAISVSWALANSPAVETLDPVAILPHLRRAAPLYPQYKNLFFVDARGFLRVTSRDGLLDPPAYVGDRPLFQRVMFAHQPGVSPIVLSPLTGRPVSPIAVPVLGSEGQFQGEVGVVLDFDHLGNRLQAIGLRTGEAIGVLDPTGRLAYYSLFELTWEQRDFSQLPEVQAVLAGETVRSTEFRSLLRPDVVLAFGGVRTPKYGWAVGVTWPVEQAFGPLQQAGRLQILVFAVILLIAIAVAAGLARLISQPVETLAEYTRALGRGELGRRVEIRTGDELQTLGEAFNAMAHQLQETIAQAQAATTAAEERAQELQEERRRRETFISAVAHELKNLMTPIIGAIQLLRRWDRLSAESRDQLQKSALAQSQRLDRLVSDLLDVSRIEARRFVLVRRSTDLVALARRAVQEQQATTTRHRLLLEAPEQLQGEWDPDRLAQVLTNLLNNAIKYSPQGGDIHLTIQQKNDQAQVCVTDQGIGLAPDDIPLLFDPYTRLYQEHRAIGLGLGLYICKAIVEAHGGSIWASSPGPSKGSTFCFSIPLESNPAGLR